VDKGVRLSEGTKAVVRYENLIGDRYLALEETPGSPRRLLPGATIPVARTSPALDILRHPRPRVLGWRGQAGPTGGRAGAASERHLHLPCLHQCGSSFDHRSARQSRQPIKDVVHETDRVSGQVLSDKEYVDTLLKDLPDIYQVLARQGLNGDYFGFYFCEVLLKLNGKGGNPIFVKLLGQPSGRCTPQ
jgi:ABC-type transporter Mla subunit MlaD